MANFTIKDEDLLSLLHAGEFTVHYMREKAAQLRRDYGALPTFTDWQQDLLAEAAKMEALVNRLHEEFTD
jgi:hypothetical protein